MLPDATPNDNKDGSAKGLKGPDKTFREISVNLARKKLAHKELIRRRTFREGVFRPQGGILHILNGIYDGASEREGGFKGMVLFKTSSKWMRYLGGTMMSEYINNTHRITSTIGKRSKTLCDQGAGSSRYLRSPICYHSTAIDCLIHRCRTTVFISVPN